MPTHVPGNRFWQILLILLALETGFFLVIVPWSPAWDNNLVTTYFDSLRHAFESDYTRGAVTGLGLVNLWVGLTEAVAFSRRGSSTAAEESPQPNSAE